VIKQAIVNQYDGPIKAPGTDMFIVNDEITKYLTGLRDGSITFDENA
jgi:hypothetical protein